MAKDPAPDDANVDLGALIASDEPLHPDLVPYMDEDGRSLRHPLVYEVWGVRPGLANHRYKLKKEALAQAIKEQEWHTVVLLHERPYRVDAIRMIDFAYGEYISDEEYWYLVGWVWADSENIWQERDEWEELLGSPRPAREAMMSTEEQEHLASLPAVLTVYRGAIAGLNDEGLSWTLDRKVARFFATRWEHLDDDRAIDVGEVDKEHVVAYFASRDESEIVVDDHAAVRLVRRELP